MQRTFKIDPSLITYDLIREICNCTATLNKAKIGRHRRGSLVLDGGKGSNGVITLNWTKHRGARNGRYKFLEITADGARHVTSWPVDMHTDHRKLIKTLTELARCS